MTAIETIAAAINRIDEKKEKLKKTFDDLLSHRSLLSRSFSLSWSEIDSHFSSLKSSLSNRFRLLQSAETSEEEETVIGAELRALCKTMDGIGLTKLLVDRLDDDAPPSLELSAEIRYSRDPASMVLDAIEGSNHAPPSSRRSVDVRRVFVLLMEALIEIDADIMVNTRERAKKLAYDWKAKIGSKPFEALLFLHLVAAFELGSEFSSRELSGYVFMIAKYKQATSVCNKIGLGSESVGNLIKNLLDSGKPILAVKFMYECGMTDGFQPIHIMKSHIMDSREAAHRLCDEDNHSLKSQNEATDKEVSALKAVIKIIKDQKLESEFYEERVEERVEELEKQKAWRKRNAANPQYEPQQKRRKRARVCNGTQVPAPSQQPYFRPGDVLMPEPSHFGLQFNPFGLVGSSFGGGVIPYLIPCLNPNLVHECNNSGSAEPSHFGLQFNPFGLVNSTFGGAVIPYMIPCLNPNPLHEWNSSVSADLSERDRLHTNTPWAAHAQQTGRKGEEMAYRYFASTYGEEAVVKWVNEESETGLPYDILIENQGGKTEYVEVKATMSTWKDYCKLSVREWQFANEKGESYIIAHVLFGNSNAILTQHRNPVKLCQEGHLRLLTLVPSKQNEVNAAF